MLTNRTGNEQILLLSQREKPKEEFRFPQQIFSFSRFELIHRFNVMILINRREKKTAGCQLLRKNMK